MKLRILPTLLICLVAATTHAADGKPATGDAELPLDQQIIQLVAQLNDDQSSERDAAEKKLLEAAGTTTAQADLFLLLLPKDNDLMPLAVRDRLSRIRRQVDARVSKASIGATTITLSAKSMPLAEVLKEIEKQTGNRIVDSREEEEASNAKGTTVTIELKDEPFWPALDKILDQAKLSINSYDGEDALSIIARDEDAAPRHGRAFYEGPLRFEVFDVQAQRSLRQPKQKTLNLQLEVAWEPRLRPIALSQPVADIAATTDDGSQLTVGRPDAVQDVDVPNGTQAAEIALPFELPDRNIKKIAKLHGKLHALIPGRHAKFEFSDVSEAAGKTQRLGGVQVTLDDIKKNNAIWELHMRFGLAEGNSTLQAHRGWVFQNLSHLVDKDGNRIENAGSETTRQTPSEVGVAYFFDVPEGLDGMTWVYETPAALADVPMEYELKDIELP